MAGHLSIPVESAAILIDVTPPDGATCSNFSSLASSLLTYWPPSLTEQTGQYSTYLVANSIGQGQLLKIIVNVENGDVLNTSLEGYYVVEEAKTPLYFVAVKESAAVAETDFVAQSSGEIKVKVVIMTSPESKVTGELTGCVENNVTDANNPAEAVFVSQISQDRLFIRTKIRDAESGLKKMMVGVGTSPGGLQVAPFTLLDPRAPHVTFSAHVQHATPIHVTVVAQNQGGSWSRFSTRLSAFDRTGPVVDDVGLTLKYKGQGEVVAAAVWRTEDKESGVRYCACLLGK